jgi:hypothetical protein
MSSGNEARDVLTVHSPYDDAHSLSLRLLSTKCTQAWNFLEQFSLVRSNILTNSSISSLKSQ